MTEKQLNENIPVAMVQELVMEAEKKQALTTVFNKKLIIKGTLWFALITVITIAVLFFYTNTGTAFAAMSHISYPYIAICLGMLFIDLMPGRAEPYFYPQTAPCMEMRLLPITHHPDATY